jgi:hypothetical protein
MVPVVIVVVVVAGRPGGELDLALVDVDRREDPSIA